MISTTTTTTVVSCLHLLYYTSSIEQQQQLHITYPPKVTEDSLLFRNAQFPMVPTALSPRKEDSWYTHMDQQSILYMICGLTRERLEGKKELVCKRSNHGKHNSQ